MNRRSLGVLIALAIVAMAPAEKELSDSDWVKQSAASNYIDWAVFKKNTALSRSQIALGLYAITWKMADQAAKMSRKIEALENQVNLMNQKVKSDASDLEDLRAAVSELKADMQVAKGWGVDSRRILAMIPKYDAEFRLLSIDSKRMTEEMRSIRSRISCGCP